MSDPKTPEDSADEFENTLKDAYPDVDWTEQDKDFLRASGLV